MQTSSIIFENLFNYLNNNTRVRNLAEVGVNHPKIGSDISKGYVALSLVNDSLSGVYDCGEFSGTRIGITIYHPNFKEISKAGSLDDIVYEVLKNYTIHFANSKIIKRDFPRWNSAVVMWCSFQMYVFYFEEKL